MLKTLGGLLIILVVAALISGGLLLVGKDRKSQVIAGDNPAGLPQGHFGYGHQPESSFLPPRSLPPNADAPFDPSNPPPPGFPHTDWPGILKNFAGITGGILIYSLGQAAFLRISQRRAARINAD